MTVRGTIRFVLQVPLRAVMVSSVSTNSAFHAYPRVRYKNVEFSHRCRPFRPVLERGASSGAKNDQGREAQATTVQTTSFYRSDTPVTQSLDRYVAVDIRHCKRYGGCVCHDFCGL